MKGLTENQIDRLQRATEETLEKTGFKVQHQALLRLAAKAGAQVNETSGTVRLPAELLRELLAQVPQQYEIAGINKDRWVVGGGERHCLAIVTDPWIVDSQTDQPRHPRLEDVRRHTRIAQRLKGVAAISLMDYPVVDVPGPYSNLRALEEHLLGHDRHMIVLAVSPQSFDRWLRIGQILSGGNLSGSRLMTVGVAVLSPLTLTKPNGELLLTACEHDFPIQPTICPMAGTTAPYSKEGTLLQANAEVIFTAALAQIIRPGHPFLYIMGPSRTDMRSGEDLYYTLDKALWKLAGVQLGRAYGMPTGAECGGTTTCRYDLQSGAEGMLFMLSAWQSEADMLSGIGSCGNAVSMAGEMMVIQMAWLQAARFLCAGIDGEHLGLESIARHGPGGNFLGDELTLERLRTDEFFDDPLFDYDGGHRGEKPMRERARQRVEELIADFHSPVPEEMQEKLRQFFRDENAGAKG